jgi:NAD(P)-dependent dehydrogenase (short-subunit alcohol dehydrogenase family)
MNLANLSAVVTRGASGLGLACARQLAVRGVSVVIADLSEDGASAAAALGPQNRFVRADVRDTAQMTEVLDAAERLAALRALIHCAGIGGSVRLVEKDCPRKYVLRLGLQCHIPPVSVCPTNSP